MVRLSDTSLKYTVVVPELLLYDNFGDFGCPNETHNDILNDKCFGKFIGLLAKSEVPRTWVVCSVPLVLCCDVCCLVTANH